MNTITLVAPMTITTTLQWLSPATMAECARAKARLSAQDELLRECEESDRLSALRHGMPHEL